MTLQIFLSTNDGTIFIFVTQKNNDIKSQAEESVMLGFNPGIYFLDIRVKPEYDREEAEDDIKEAALKRDSSSSVIPVFFSSSLSFPCSFLLPCHSRAWHGNLKEILGTSPNITKKKAPQQRGFFHPSKQLIQKGNVAGCLAAAVVINVKIDPRTFGQTAQSGLFQCRNMNKHVFFFAVGINKTITFFVVKPLNRTS